MKAKKTYQEWCVDTLLAILKSRAEYCGDDHDQGYIYVIKAIINHYASMYYCDRQMHLMQNDNKRHLNLWWDHLNEKNKDSFFSRLLMSKKAQKIAHSNCSAKVAKGELHLEHITPCGYIYDRLCSYGALISKKNIKRELKFGRLVLLTKKEAKVLDGAGQRFSQKEVLFLRRHFPSLIKDEGKEIARIIREDEHAKDSGMGLLRMAKLANSTDPKISFVYADGTPFPPKEWMDYFDKTEFVIKKESK